MNELKEMYLEFLKEQTYTEGNKIILPFRKVNGNYIGVYIEKTDEQKFVVSDYGETLSELSLYVDTDTIEKIKKFISKLMLIKIKYNELSIQSSEKYLPEMIHTLATVILQIDAISYYAIQRIKPYYIYHTR